MKDILDIEYPPLPHPVQFNSNNNKTNYLYCGSYNNQIIEPNKILPLDYISNKLWKGNNEDSLICYISGNYKISITVEALAEIKELVSLYIKINNELVARSIKSLRVKESFSIHTEFVINMKRGDLIDIYMNFSSNSCLTSYNLSLFGAKNHWLSVNIT